MNTFREQIFKFLEMAECKDILSKVHEFERNQWISEEDIELYQFKKLKNLVEHASNTVPFYKKHFENNDSKNINSIADIKKLPFITKDLIKGNLTGMTSQEYSLSDLQKSSTGGSTGKPLTFYWTKEQSDCNAAVAFKNYRMTGWDFFAKTILFTASPLDLSKHQKLYKKFKNIIKREKVIAMFGMSEVDFEAFYHKINKYQPKVIMGFVSSLYLFSKWLLSKNYSDIQVPVILQVAEKVEDFQIKTIEETLHGRFYKHYGAREAIGIGVECEKRVGMHVNQDTLLVEILKDNRDAKPGENGEIVITDLNSFGMPLIRYKIGDVGRRISDQCKCGRNSWLFEVSEGRIQDIISTPDGRYISASFFPHLFKEVSEKIFQYQVIQKKINKLDIKINKKNNFTEADEHFLENEILEKTGSDMDIIFEYPAEILPEKSGKFRAVKSEISVNFGN